MKPKILIVDDVPDSVAFLPDWLEREGYRTSLVTQGQQALVLAETVHPDLILMDVMMPGMDGIETCRRLRTNPATANIPVILVSGRSPFEARAEGLLAGAADYVTKPIHFPDLLERITRLTDGVMPDPGQLLDELTATALAVLPCQMAWLLTAGDDGLQLVHRALAAGPDNEIAHRFLTLAQAHYPDLCFSLTRDHNLLAEVLASQSVFTNVTNGQLQALPDGAGLSSAFGGVGCHYISLLPLVAPGGRAVGLLILATGDGPLDESRRTHEIISALQKQMALEVDNARLFDEMRRRVTGLSTLLDASAAVSSTLDFGDILDEIAHRLSAALQVERIVIADWRRPANHVQTLAEVVNAYWPPDSGPERRIEDLPLTCSVFESGMMMLATDTILHGVPQPVVEINHSGLRTIGGFPFWVDGDTLGVLTLHTETDTYEFPAERANAVGRVVAEWVANVAAKGPDVWWSQSSLTDLCLRSLQAGEARWCAVSYWDRARNAIRLLREVGRALWLEQRGQSWNVTQYSRLATVLETGQAVTLQLPELEDDPNEQAYLRRVGASTGLLVPLPVRGAPGGLVKLLDSRRTRRGFDRAEVSLCQGIANVVGNALENAQLYAVQERRASALEAAYKELQESDQIKDDLMQNVSHELRTPLTHILGYARLLLDDAFGPLVDPQRTALELVLNKAQHLAELVKDMVAVQTSEAHQLEPKPVRLDRVMMLALRSMAGHAQEYGIQIVSHIPTHLPLVYADPVRIGEVFEELLENAIKFSPGASEIRVTLEDTGGPMLRASVRDYGIGIDPDEHEKIFRRFYQVDSGTARRFGGTGLGLAIVRQVVEGHNGRVWVESEPDQGSCFYLTLPKASAVMKD
jgi:signal transduction histidine kinase/CheY-like chemotaxis protein